MTASSLSSLRALAELVTVNVSTLAAEQLKYATLTNADSPDASFMRCIDDLSQCSIEVDDVVFTKLSRPFMQ